MPENKPFRDFIYLVFFLFVIGMLLFIPFPYHLLPRVGTHLTNYTISSLSILWNEKNLSLSSDSKGMILCIKTWFLMCCIFSFLLVLTKKVNKIYPFTKPYFDVLVTYYLAMQLLNYGFDKVFKHQFYLPEPNTLFTNLGNLNKDILYWSTMGSSYSFTVFGGIMEIIPAILLLFRPTRLLGACISFAVFVQIVMLNVGFGISVKCLSSFLLLLSFYLISPYFLSLYAFFIQGKQAQITQNESFIFKKTNLKVYLLLKYTTIAFILLETLYPFLREGNFNDDKMPRPPYHGAYQVQTFWKNSDSLSCENKQKWKRIFFHRQGYFIIQNEEEKMQDFEYELDINKNEIRLSENGDSLICHFSIHSSQNGIFLDFEGKCHQDSIRMKVKKIALDSLPIFN